MAVACSSRIRRARLKLLRNAIIARRGGTFESPLLRSLLSGERYPPSPSYTPDRLTPVDRESVQRIQRRERELGGPIGDSVDELFSRSQSARRDRTADAPAT